MKGQACVVSSTTPDGKRLTTCQIPCRSGADCPVDSTGQWICQPGTVEVPDSICVKPETAKK